MFSANIPQPKRLRELRACESSMVLQWERITIQSFSQGQTEWETNGEFRENATFMQENNWAWKLK